MSGRELDAAGITARRCVRRTSMPSAQRGTAGPTTSRRCCSPVEAALRPRALRFARYADEVVDDLTTTLIETQKADWLDARLEHSCATSGQGHRRTDQQASSTR